MADGSLVFDTKVDNSKLKKGAEEQKKIIEGVGKASRKTFAEMSAETGKSIDEIKQEVKDLAEVYQKQGLNIPNSYKKAYKELGLYSKEAREDVEDDAEEMGRAHKEGADKAEKSWKGSFSAIGTAAKTLFSVSAKAITAVTGALSAGAGVVAKIGSGFEAAMSVVSAVSGATGEDLDALREKAKEMGASTKFSATEAAEAMNYMAMAGWKTEDMLEGIDGIMNLAAASGADLATTSDIVTDALTAFGLSAKDATHFSDILAAASSNANTNVTMMGETFKYVAPVAGALGFSAEDCATAIGLMANSGIKASQAGTSLRSILTRLSNPTKEVQNAMDALGVSVVNNDGSMKSLNEIMGDLREGFAGLSEAEQAQMASAIGGQEAMSGLLAIVNASDEDFNKLQDSIYGYEGAAAAMAETMQDNLQGQITILKSGLEGLAISLYESVQEPLKEIAKEAQGMVQQLQDAFNEGGVEGLVAAFGDVLAQIVERVAEAAPDLIQAAAGLVSSFCDSIKDSPGVGDAAAGLISALVTALLSCATDLVSAAFVLGLQLLDGLARQLPELTAFALACILTLAEGLVSSLPQLAESAMLIVQGLVDALLIRGAPLLLNGAVQLFNGILSALPIVVENLLSALPDLITSIITFLGEAAPQIADAAIVLLYGIIDAFPKIVSAIAQNLPQIANAIIIGLGKAAPKILQAALGFLGRLVEAIPDIAVSLGKALVELVKNLAGGLLEGVPTQELAGKIADWLSGIGESISTWFSELGEKISTAVSELADTVVTFFAELPGRISEWLTNVIDGITEWGTELIDQAVQTGSQFAENVVTFIAELPEKIAYWLGYILTSIIVWGLDLINWAAENIPLFVESIVTFIAELPGRIAEWLAGVIAAVVSWCEEMITQAVQVGSQFVENVVTFISELPGRIWEWLTNTINRIVQWCAQMIAQAVQAGSQFVQNVISYVSGLPGKVQTWLTNTINRVLGFVTSLKNRATEAGSGFFTNIVNALASLPGKMAEIGSNIVSGIWRGISSGWNWLVDQVKGLANSLFNGVKDALGIHSPSKKFRWLGEMCVEGMDEPFVDYNPYGTLKASMLAGEKDFKNSFKAGFIAGNPAAVSTASQPQVTNQQTVNIYQPVKTPSETARAIRLEQQYGMAGE